MKIKLFGTLVNELGFKEKDLDPEDSMTIIDILNKIFSKNRGNETSYLNVTILVDGVEASTLPQGLNSKPKEVKELIIVPVSHGG